MNDTAFFANFLPLYPELVVAVGIMVTIAVDFFVPTKNSRVATALAGIATLVIAIGLLVEVVPQHPVTHPFSAVLVADALSWYCRFFIYAATALILLMLMWTNEFGVNRHGEIVALLLGGALGAGTLTLANNIVVFVFSLETLSVCSYVLAGAKKFNRASSEASLKYLLYGALTTALTLYGFSYLYGLSGTLEIEKAVTVMGTSDQHLLGALIVTFVAAAILFKLAIVPFHFWCPDVYQGAPTVVSAFLAIVSKAAIFAALLRLALPASLFMFILNTTYGRINAVSFTSTFLLLAVITMTVANIMALRQNDVKRLLGYSAIAHAGYMLMAFAVIQVMAVKSLMFYLLAYGVANLGVFWICALMIAQHGHAHLSTWRGLAKTNPLLVVCLFVFLLSLIGLPPTAGFSGKFLLFGSVLSQGLAVVDSQPTLGFTYLSAVIIAVLNSVISLVYYIKPIRVAVLEESTDSKTIEVSVWTSAILSFMAIALIVLINFDLVISHLEF